MLSHEHVYLIENYNLIMLVPAGCDMYEALAPLRRDMKLLEQGVETRLGKLHVYPSFLPADLLQKYENCRHLGNTATMNCASCWCDTTERCDTKFDILDVSNTRRREQTNVIIQQLQEEESQLRFAKEDVADRTVAKLRQKYGIQNRPCLYEDVEVDPHMQSPTDPDHLVWFGLVRIVLRAIKAAMNPAQRHEFAIRVADFQYPKGWSVIQLSLMDKVGLTVQMAFYQKLLLVAMFVLFPCTSTSHFNTFIQMAIWIRHLFAVQHSDASHKQVQMSGDKMLSRINETFDNLLDRPNGHNIRELTYRFLPMAGTVHRLKCGSFEARHKLPKQHMRTTRAREAHLQMTRIDAELAAVRFAIHGGTWGDGASLGEAFLNLRNPLDSSIPHPLLHSFTRYLRVTPSDDAVATRNIGFGTWDPCKWEWKLWSSGVAGGQREQSPPSQADQDALRDVVEVSSSLSS